MEGLRCQVRLLPYDLENVPLWASVPPFVMWVHWIRPVLPEPSCTSIFKNIDCQAPLWILCVRTLRGRAWICGDSDEYLCLETNGPGGSKGPSTSHVLCDQPKNWLYWRSRIYLYAFKSLSPGCPPGFLTREAYHKRLQNSPSILPVAEDSHFKCPHYEEFWQMGRSQSFLCWKMTLALAGISYCPRQGTRDGWKMRCRLELSVSQDHQCKQPETETGQKVMPRKGIKWPLEKWNSGVGNIDFLAQEHSVPAHCHSGSAHKRSAQHLLTPVAPTSSSLVGWELEEGQGTWSLRTKLSDLARPSSLQIGPLYSAFLGKPWTPFFFFFFQVWLTYSVTLFHVYNMI